MPEIPENAPKPQDHKPKKKSTKAREAEAGDGFVTIETRGVELRIPVGGKMPIAAFELFQEGKELPGTKMLLGPEQWAAFMATNPTLDDLAELGQKLQDATGE